MPRETTEAQSAKLALLPGQRPEPPSILTEAQAKYWREIVATKPSNWFTPDNYPLLTAMCQQCVIADRMIEHVNSFPSLLLDTPEGLAEYAQWNKLLGNAQKMIAMLAMKMRLTQQSKIEPRTAAGTAAASGVEQTKPWQMKVVGE